MISRQEKSQETGDESIFRRFLIIFLSCWFVTFGALAFYIYEEKTHIHMGDKNYYWAGMMSNKTSDGKIIYSPIYTEVKQ